MRGIVSATNALSAAVACLLLTGCTGGSSSPPTPAAEAATETPTADASRTPTAAAPTRTVHAFTGAERACKQSHTLARRIGDLASQGLNAPGDAILLMQDAADKYRELARHTTYAFGPGSGRVGKLADQVADDWEYASIAFLGRSGNVVSPEHAAAAVRQVVTDLEALESFCSRSGNPDTSSSTTQPPATDEPRASLSRELGSQQLTDVRLVQKRLVGLGYGPLEPDGYFGSQTARAVRNFQMDAGLDVDGVVGPLTWAALFGAPADTLGDPQPFVAPIVPVLPGGAPHALCSDGTLSYSGSNQGTCSWHGGVDSWLH